MQRISGDDTGVGPDVPLARYENRICHRMLRLLASQLQKEARIGASPRRSQGERQMFKKENNEEESRNDEKMVEPTLAENPKASLAQELNTRSVSYIGPTVSFKGEISANEGLVVEGEFEGKLNQQDKSLTVGKGGRVVGEIRASVVDIRGKFEGDIYCTEIVHLYSTAEVSGTINCGRIVLDDGAVFDGTIDMQKDVVSLDRDKLGVAENDGTITSVAS
jgi:cytoskeletal protein CcmA (bactofilin family)